MNTFTKGQKVTTTVVKELEGKVLTVKAYLPKIKAYHVTDGKLNWALQEQDLELVTEQVTDKEELLSFEEVATIVFETEQANGLHEGVTFEEWLAAKQETNTTTEAVEVAETVEEAKETDLVVNNEDPKIEVEVEEKETAKGTQYIHTVTVNGKKHTRKSKNKFNFAIIIGRHDEAGEYMVTYRTTHHDAVAEKDSWKSVAKCWIEEIQ